MEQWSCPVCTFLNEQLASACAMCGQISPAVSAMQASPSSKPVKSEEPELVETREVLRKHPRILEQFVSEGVFATILSVVVHAASPRNRVTALLILCSVSYYAPPRLYNDIKQRTDPGGEMHLGVVASALQSRHSKVVSAALKLACLELWRSPEGEAVMHVHREGILGLVQAVKTRFIEDPAQSSSSIKAIHLFANLWLEKYASFPTVVFPNPLTPIVTRLQGNPSSPRRKKAKETFDKEEDSPLMRVLQDLAGVLERGVTSFELGQAGLASQLNACFLDAHFNEVFSLVFSRLPKARRQLLAKLHEEFNAKETFPIRVAPEGELALKKPLQLVLTPDKVALKGLETKDTHLCVLDKHALALSLPLDVVADPLASVEEVEVYAWGLLQRRVWQRVREVDQRACACVGGFLCDDSSTLQIGVGSKVVRGKDWKWGNQDGGVGSMGRVVALKSWNGQVGTGLRVRWEKGGENVYRWNLDHGSVFDLALGHEASSLSPPRSLGLECDVVYGLSSSQLLELDIHSYVGCLDVDCVWRDQCEVLYKDDLNEHVMLLFPDSHQEWVPLSSSRLSMHVETCVDQYDNRGPGLVFLDQQKYGYPSHHLYHWTCTPLKKGMRVKAGQVEATVRAIKSDVQITPLNGGHSMTVPMDTVRVEVGEEEVSGGWWCNFDGRSFLHYYTKISFVNILNYHSKIDPFYNSI